MPHRHRRTMIPRDRKTRDRKTHPVSSVAVSANAKPRVTAGFFCVKRVSTANVSACDADAVSTLVRRALHRWRVATRSACLTIRREQHLATCFCSRDSNAAWMSRKVFLRRSLTRSVASVELVRATPASRQVCAGRCRSENIASLRYRSATSGRSG